MHVWGSPETRTFGRLRVDVAVGPIARMFDAEDWQQPANAGGNGIAQDADGRGASLNALRSRDRSYVR